MPEKTLEGKKIVMIIAFRDFRDQEYFVPKQIFEGAGFEVKTASNERGLAIGADGGEVEIGLLVSEINHKDFDAIVFIGGPGCLQNLDNRDSYQLASDALLQNKIVGAICVAPLILAKAGVLQRKRATVWTSAMDRQAANTLKSYGATYERAPVVIDGNIITADGPAASQKFGEAILGILTR